MEINLCHIDAHPYLDTDFEGGFFEFSLFLMLASSLTF